MRPRININMVCSSSNYELTRQIHIYHLNKEHNNRMKEIAKITTTIKIPYVKVFGKLIQITKEEANKLNKDVVIIWK